MGKQQRKSLGERLVEKGKVTPEDLQRVLGALKEHPGERFGTVIVQMGIVEEKDIVEELSEQMGIPFWQLDDTNPPLESAKIVTLEEAKDWKAIPVNDDGGILEVAMVDPLDLETVDQLKKKTRRSIKPYFATLIDIQHIIDIIERSERKDVLENLQMSGSMGDTAEEISDSVVEAVNAILDKAIDAHASDIHIECFETEVGVRYRIDGVMHKVRSLPPTIAAALISRIKIMADLDIAEKRVPQDGRIQVKHEDDKVDIRLSTFPGIYGENAVMRILDQRKGLMSLDANGFPEGPLNLYRDMLHRTAGILLVTGPTGSGKTTTLYGGLSEIDANSVSVLTLEDPVEYKLAGIRQAQVNPKAGFDFAAGLRAMVRQDPDVIMFGEIRDKETATIAIQSALTGHLVMSTLHTNDAVGAVTRLINMGVEPFLIASSMVGVVAQRLVRSLCTHCREPLLVDDTMLDKFADNVVDLGDSTFYQANGCEKCMGTGYVGRVGIYELLDVTEEIQHMIVAGENRHAITAQARKEGFIDMRSDGLIKASKGITTIQEVLRVT